MKVINLSLGSESFSQTVKSAIDRAVGAGVLVVAAAGNSGRSGIEFPANQPTVVAVGALDARKERAYYSNTGPDLDLVAPGGDCEREDTGDNFGDCVFQQMPDPDFVDKGRYDQFCYCGLDGTRMATPHVAAAAALLFSQGFTDGAAVRAALEQTAERLGGGADRQDRRRLRAHHGGDRRGRTLDPSTLDQPWRPSTKAPRRFRLGVIRGSTQGAQPNVAKNFEEAVKALKGFCDIEDDVPFPDFPSGRAISTIIRSDAVAAFRGLIESGAVRRLRAAGRKRSGFSTTAPPAADYERAHDLRLPITRALEGLSEEYDALVSPSCPTVASPIAVDYDEAYPRFAGGPAIIPAGNLAGQPALTVPNGFGASGLPTGILFTGRAFSDETLVAIAAEYQQRTDWHLQGARRCDSYRTSTTRHRRATAAAIVEGAFRSMKVPPAPATLLVLTGCLAAALSLPWPPRPALLFLAAAVAGTTTLAGLFVVAEVLGDVARHLQ